MGITVIGYKEPEGLCAAYTNPGPRRSPTVRTGEIRYHYSDKEHEFEGSLNLYYDKARNLNGLWRNSGFFGISILCSTFQ